MTNTESKAVVDRLFEKFALRWARVFLNEYEGLDVADVKDEWAGDLTAFSIDQARQAYENCKDNQYPPSLPTFKALCKAARVDQPKKVEQMFTEEQMARNRARVRQMVADFARLQDEKRMG